MYYIAYSLEQFKGSKKYYQSNNITNVDELIKLLEVKDAETIAGDFENMDGHDILEKILSDRDLARLLDRYPGETGDIVVSDKFEGNAVQLTESNIDGNFL